MEGQSNVPQIIADNILSIRVGYRIGGPINIARFPNLKTLTMFFHTPLDYITVEVLDYPSIKEVKHMINPKTRTIMKKNGKLVLIGSDTWYINYGIISNQSMYENIKKNYKYISLDINVTIDKLIDYEMESKIAKKMTIDMSIFGMDNIQTLKILDVFNIKTSAKNCRLQTWLKQAKSYIGNGKISFIDE